MGESPSKETRSFMQDMSSKVSDILVRAKVPTPDYQLDELICSLIRLLMMYHHHLQTLHWVIFYSFPPSQNACSVSLGFSDDPINASAILVMPMVSSKITGFRGNALDRSKILSMKSFGWNRISLDEEEAKMLENSPRIS